MGMLFQILVCCLIFYLFFTLLRLKSYGVLAEGVPKTAEMVSMSKINWDAHHDGFVNDAKEGKTWTRVSC